MTVHIGGDDPAIGDIDEIHEREAIFEINIRLDVGPGLRRILRDVELVAVKNNRVLR